MLRLLWPIILLCSVHGSPCTGSNRTTYLRSSSLRLMEFATHSLSKVTLNVCADSCTTEANGHPCASFEYDSRSQECALHPEPGQPLGPSVLARADGNIAFFQQICVQEEYLCPTPYAFERHPQSMLIGHAMKVVTTEGLSECLTVCLSSQNNLSSPCNSLVYFYETGECIMNRETKADHPELFRENVQETLVDYFENTCVDVECSGGVLHWLRSEEFSISHEKDVIVESMSGDECRALCASNSIGEERFPCRSYVYSSSKQECHLSADSGYSGRRNSSFSLNPISSGEYYQKYCLNSTVRCLDASFEQVPNRKMNTEGYKSLHTTSVSFCLSQCIEEGANCQSVTYDYEKDVCHLSSDSQFSQPSSFSISNSTDYFDKICDTAPLEKEQKREKAQAARQIETAVEPPKGLDELRTDEKAIEQIEKEVGEKREKQGIAKVLPALELFPLASPVPSSVDQERTAAEGTVIDDDEDFHEVEGREETPVRAHLASECRMSGVTVSVDFATNTTGSIYIKDHFASCRAEFVDSLHTALHIPFPRSDEATPRCPGIEMSPSHWSFAVVVQKNEMSSPSLVTSTDRLFNVTCDYTQLVEKTSGPGLSPQFDDSPGPSGPELRSKRIQMTIMRSGRPVTVVPLGEHVELVWTVSDPEAGLGFFINECVAERVGGAAPEPEPLKIIRQGCPEEKVMNRLLDSPVEEIPTGYSTRMKVFRFDGSRRVRIKCTVDVCVDRCPPVTCDGLLSASRESFGRKKRQAMAELEGMLRRFKPDFSLSQTTEVPDSNISKIRRRSTVSGTLTVTDREEKKKSRKPRPEFSSMPSQFSVCLVGWQVLVLSLVAVLLGAVGGGTIVRFIGYNRSRQTDDRSCVSSLSDTTCSGYSATSSLYAHSQPTPPSHKDPPRIYEVPYNIR